MLGGHAGASWAGMEREGVRPGEAWRRPSAAACAGLFHVLSHVHDRLTFHNCPGSQLFRPLYGTVAHVSAWLGAEAGAIGSSMHAPGRASPSAGVRPRQHDAGAMVSGSSVRAPGRASPSAGVRPRQHDAGAMVPGSSVRAPGRASPSAGVRPRQHDALTMHSMHDRRAGHVSERGYSIGRGGRDRRYEHL